MAVTPLEARFLSHLEWHDGHLLWTGALDEDGYGVFQVGRYVRRRAHRFQWELATGRLLPPTVCLVKSNRCTLRHCCALACWEPVTSRRAAQLASLASRRTPQPSQRTMGLAPCAAGHCPEHAYRSGSGRWFCRECRRVRQHRHRGSTAPGPLECCLRTAARLREAA